MRSVICDSGEWDYSHNTIELGQGGADLSVCLCIGEGCGGKQQQQQHVGVRGPRGAQECPSSESHVPLLPPPEMLMCFEYILHVIGEYKPPGTSC